MAMTTGALTASTACAVTGTYPPEGVPGKLASTRVSQAAGVDVETLKFGTGPGQVDLITCSDRTIGPGGAATYDLYTGTDLRDLAGLVCALRRVKYVQVGIVSGGDGAGVRVGGAGAATWAGFFAAAGDKALIFPGGPPYLGGAPAGVAVGPTAKNLQVENPGAVAVTVRIVVAGTSS